MIKLSGATPVFVKNKEEDGFALNIGGIRAAITPRTKAVMINTPNNPTGAGHYCIASISEAVKERCVIVNGFSKAYSMTGWRVGYAAGNNALIKGITALQSHTTSNTCSIAQYAALEALRGPQESLEIMRREFDKRRLFLLNRLNAMDGITCVNADGAFYLMPNVTAYYGRTYNGKKIRDSFDMADYLLEEARIAVVPGAAFEAPDNLRISYSCSMESLITGMDRMEAALKKL